MCHRRRPIQEALPVSLDAPLEKKNKTPTTQNGGKVAWLVVVVERGGRFNTCCSILERGAQAKLAAQMANVYNGIESCPA